MFENLSTALQKTFKNLRGYGKLTEKNIKDSMREVRMALLEADVNFKVARDFVKRVQEKCMGEEVLGSITPGQLVIKRVNDELVELFGGAHAEFDLTGRPAAVMMMGLHGSGKTTSSGKLALRWKKSGRRVLLVACDIRRPAAVEQLMILAGQVGCEIVRPEPGETVPMLGKRAAQVARDGNYDVVIYDTGGRFQVDEELVQELKEFESETRPNNKILVLDAAIGQESVNVAETFRDAVGLTGLILTKLDGDARGGAALSVHAVTGCPILMTGSGEKMEDLEPFYPDRMASRILGMGDVVSFVEKAQGVIDQEEAPENAGEAGEERDEPRGLPQSDPADEKTRTDQQPVRYDARRCHEDGPEEKGGHCQRLRAGNEEVRVDHPEHDAVGAAQPEKNRPQPPVAYCQGVRA